jgi:hypothetical protein
MDRRKTAGPSTALPRLAGTGGMTISLKFDELVRKTNKVTDAQEHDFVASWRFKKPASSQNSIVCQTS